MCWAEGCCWRLPSCELLNHSVMLGNFLPECLENTLQVSKQWKDVEKTRQNKIKRWIAKYFFVHVTSASAPLHIHALLISCILQAPAPSLAPPPYTSIHHPHKCRACKVRHAFRLRAFSAFSCGEVLALHSTARRKHQSPSGRTPACASSMKLFSYVTGCKLSSISTASLSKAGFDSPSGTMEFHSKNHESVRCCKHWLWNAYLSVCPFLFPLHSSTAKTLYCGLSFCTVARRIYTGFMWNISANYLYYAMY